MRPSDDRPPAPIRLAPDGPVRLIVTGGSGFIGQALQDHVLALGVAVLNLDLVPPEAAALRSTWLRCDVTDRAELRAAVAAFAPTHIVHLAARADLGGRSLDDYAVNFVGTRHIVEIAAASANLRRCVLASTQMVCRVGVAPRHDEDFHPNGWYAESKVHAERCVPRDGSRRWLIVRPTNIWGPRHPFLARAICLHIARGTYLHPDGPPVRKVYGYVENAVDQLWRLTVADATPEWPRLLYLGDAPIDSGEWVDAFAIALRGRPVRRAPRRLLRLGARLGDLCHAFNLPAPLRSDRLERMLTEDAVPIDSTLRMLGSGPVDLKTGVDRTARWLRLCWNGRRQRQSSATDVPRLALRPGGRHPTATTVLSRTTFPPGRQSTG